MTPNTAIWLTDMDTTIGEALRPLIESISPFTTTTPATLIASIPKKAGIYIHMPMKTITMGTTKAAFIAMSTTTTVTSITAITTQDIAVANGATQEG